MLILDQKETFATGHQGRIQDFPLGGGGGATMSGGGAFRRKHKCNNERIGFRWAGRALGGPPGSANGHGTVYMQDQQAASRLLNQSK